MNGRLLILGSGGHGRVVADAALDCGYSEIAFLDDAGTPAIAGPGPVLGPFNLLSDLRAQWPAAIVAVGNNRTRAQMFAKVHAAGFALPSIVHPSAIISRNATVGAGVFIAPGVIINTGALIGDAAIVNTGARIDHDCRIGAASHIAPGATLSGDVTVGERVWLGTGCSVRQGVVIGNDALVGVGAAVVGDLAGDATYIGVPARRLHTAM